ncbi:hypothetical protein HK098_007076 [Nowakowskiella sp. JEL0407]|nr:hypothetical protein HK098_007076 [Nowakowskiella sp. JEL0407]
MSTGYNCQYQNWYYSLVYGVVGIFLVVLAPTMLIMLRSIRDTQGIQFDMMVTASFTCVCFVLYFLIMYEFIPSISDWGYFGPNHLIYFVLGPGHIMSVVVPLLQLYWERRKKAKPSLIYNLDSFSKVLVDKNLFELLRNAAARDLCSEQIIFLEEVELFKKRVNGSTEDLTLTKGGDFSGNKLSRREDSFNNTKTGQARQELSSSHGVQTSRHSRREDSFSSGTPSKMPRRTDSHSLQLSPSTPALLASVDRTSNLPFKVALKNGHSQMGIDLKPMEINLDIDSSNKRRSKYEYNLIQQRTTLITPEYDPPRRKSEPTLLSHRNPSLSDSHLMRAHYDEPAMPSISGRLTRNTRRNSLEMQAISLHCGRLVEAFINENSPLEINISADTRFSIIDKFNNDQIAAEIFDDAKEEIIQLLVTKKAFVFPHFLCSRFPCLVSQYLSKDDQDLLE